MRYDLRFKQDNFGVFHRLPDYIPDAWLERITVELDADCHVHFLWTGWNNGEGHAKFKRGGKTLYCHRDIVERVERRTLTRWNYVDHKCARKNCLNYYHLEAVSPGENTRRGPGGQQQYKPAGAYQEPEPSSATWQEKYGDPLDGV